MKNNKIISFFAGCLLLAGLATPTGCKQEGYAPWIDPDAIDNTGVVRPPVYKGHNLPRLRGVNMYPSTFIQADLDTLIRWNVNHLRWNMDFSGDLTNMNSYMIQLRGQCDIVANWLPKLEAAGIYISLCMVLMPGGRHPDNNVPVINTEQAYQDTYVEAWRYIAERFKGEKAIWAYELSNEPNVDVINQNVAAGCLSWMPLQRKVGKAIREEDPETAIMVTYDGVIMSARNDVDFFDPDDLPNVVFTDHMYEPLSFTHQGIVPEGPTRMTYPNENYNKETLRAHLEERMFSLGRKNNIHVYIGEFGAVRWAEGAGEYIRDVIELLEEYGCDWAHFSYSKGGAGLVHLTGFSPSHLARPNPFDDGENYIYTTDPPEYSEETPQMKALSRWLKLNQH